MTECRRPQGSVSPYGPNEVVQPTCTMALGYRKCIKTNIGLDGFTYHFLGGGHEIYLS